MAECPFYHVLEITALNLFVFGLLGLDLSWPDMQSIKFNARPWSRCVWSRLSLSLYALFNTLVTVSLTSAQCRVAADRGLWMTPFSMRP